MLIKPKHNNYTVKFSDGKEKVVTDAINNSSIMLYFEEPKHIERVFSEQLGNFNRLIKVKEGIYKMINQKGNENLYYYTKGKLDSIEVDSGMVSFEMRVKK